MPTITTKIGRWGRATVVALAFTTAVTTVACKDFLTAKNPGLVQVDRLADTALVELMANSAIGSFQDVYPWLSYYSAIFTDELRNHHVFFEEGLFDQRRVQQDNGTYSTFHYAPLQRGRWLADSMAGRIRGVYGDSALRDLRLARTYAFAGYGLIMLAEMLCEAPLSSEGVRYSKPYNTNELLTFAKQRFDSAIKIAAASRAANAAVTAGPTAALAARYVLGADSVRNWAYVGLARASLGMGDNPAAITAAQQVTPMAPNNDFEYRLYYSATTALNIFNFYQDRLSGGAGVTTGSVTGTPFIGLDDARVPHPLTTAGAPLAEAATGGSFVVPNSPASFSSYNGTKTGADFTYGASIRLASLLEVQYILAEAGGSTGTNVGGQSNIAFVESRRTAFPSNTATAPTTAVNFLDNLIDQRRRDFYLDGHRMGDLRRYVKFYSRDYWPTGPFYGSTTISFGAQMCWPLNVAEITNNPLVPKPYAPPAGP
jgi:hypothetical protein